MRWPGRGSEAKTTATPRCSWAAALPESQERRAVAERLGVAWSSADESALSRCGATGLAARRAAASVMARRLTDDDCAVDRLAPGGVDAVARSAGRRPPILPVLPDDAYERLLLSRWSRLPDWGVGDFNVWFLAEVGVSAGRGSHVPAARPVPQSRPSTGLFLAAVGGV